MTREFSVLIERDAEGFYVATVPALRGCHTQARSLDELMVRLREAVELCLVVAYSEYMKFYGEKVNWPSDSIPDRKLLEKHYHSFHLCNQEKNGVI